MLGVPVRLRAEVFPERRVGLLHGQLPSDEKERVMRAFLGCTSRVTVWVRPSLSRTVRLMR